MSPIAFVRLTFTSAIAAVFLNVTFWFGPPSILVVVLLLILSVGLPSVLSIGQYWANDAKQKENETTLAQMKQEIHSLKDSSHVNGKDIAELGKKVFELEDRLESKQNDS